MKTRFETSACLSALPSIVHGFFTRHGGVSQEALSSLNCALREPDSPRAVHENRRRALASLGLNAHVLVVPRLAHGNHSIVIDTATDFSEVTRIDADAVITAQPRVALGITYADCLPILVAARDQSVIAAIHSGWRGIRCDVIGATIKKIRELFGATDLVAAVGPAISQDGFLVTDEVSDFFLQHWPQYSRGTRLSAHVDLTSIGKAQLYMAGVAHVEKVGGYVDKNPKDYFSHRRDCGKSGRHLALIAKILPNPSSLRA